MVQINQTFSYFLWTDGANCSSGGSSDCLLIFVKYIIHIVSNAKKKKGGKKIGSDEIVLGTRMRILNSDKMRISIETPFISLLTESE